MPESVNEIKTNLEAWFTMEEFAPTPTEIGPEYIVDSHNGYILRSALIPSGIIDIVGVQGYGGFKATASTHDYYVNRPDLDKRFRLPSRDWTICFWTKRPVVAPGVTQNTYILGITDLSVHPTGASAGIRIFVEYSAAPCTTPSLHVQVGSGAAMSDVESQWTGDTGAWVHIAVVYRRSVGSCGYVDFYKNGVWFHTNYYDGARFAQLNTAVLHMFYGQTALGVWDNHKTALDEVGIWSRQLTIAEIKWLYDEQATYDDLPDEAEADEECGKSIECCQPNMFGYAATSSVVASRAMDHLGHAPEDQDIACPSELPVTLTPSDLMCARFPLWIGLSSSDPRAGMVYTTDGSEPASDGGGTTQEYTGPVELVSPYTIFRYRPVISGCPDYPIQTLSVEDCGLFDFAWLCTFTDKVGGRGIWAPDGNSDHNWNVVFDFDVFTHEIYRIELFELDEDLLWTTGTAWSTASIIYPYKEEPTKPYQPYPLWVEEYGMIPVPVVTAYMASIGNQTGYHTWDLFGNIRETAPTNHFFQIRMVTSAGTMEAIIPVGPCSPRQPICRSIPITATPDCASPCDIWVDLQWAISPAEAGGTYTLRSTRFCVDPTESVVLATATGVAAGVYTYQHTGLDPNCIVEYSLEYVYPSGCIARIEDRVTTLSCPTISIAVNKAEYLPTETMQVTIAHSLFQAGYGSCTPGDRIYVLLDGAPWFDFDPLTDGNPYLAAFAVAGISDGDHIISATVCNKCGDVTATAGFRKLESLQPPLFTCSDPTPTIVGMDPSVLEDIPATYNCDVSPDTPGWDGTIRAPTPGWCLWSNTGEGFLINEEGVKFRVVVNIGFSIINVPAAPLLPCAPAAPNLWGYWLKISGCSGGNQSNNNIIWQGYKIYGIGADGTYTFAKNMCLNYASNNAASLNGPATITLVDLT